MKMSIKEMVSKIKSQEMTSEELVNSYIEQITEREKDVNAFLTLMCDEAVEKAKQIDEKIKKGEKTGKLAGATICKVDDELMLINSSGVAIRINVSDISVTSRSAMGVTLMRTNEDEKVVAIAKILSSDDSEKKEESISENTETSNIENNDSNDNE